MEQTRTLRLRIRDKHGALLTRMARDVNFVWNYCNDLTYRMWRDRKQWPSGFDVQKYLKGSSEFFQLIVRASNKLRKSTPQDVGNSKKVSFAGEHQKEANAL